jgi:hypothetical protein
LKEHIVVKALDIGEQWRDLEDWAACHANAPHPRAPTDDKDDLFIVKSQGRATLLNSDNIRDDRQEVDKKNEVPDVDLEDTWTSPTSPK